MNICELHLLGRNRRDLVWKRGIERQAVEPRQLVVGQLV
jgi:hypothetical protein